MLRRRVNVLNFAMKLVTLLLPSMAFAVAGYVRFGAGLIPIRGEVDPTYYFGLLFFTTLVWAPAADYYGLGRLDVLFRAGRPAWRAMRACAVTYFVVTAATFFYRSASFSRLFVAMSGAALWVLTALVDAAFRSFLVRAHRKGKVRARVVIVGADAFAERAARSLAERPAVPSAVVGFVRLPGQDTVPAASPLVELDATKIRETCGEIDEIVLAVPPARMGEFPGILARLDPLSVPVRALLDLGTGIVPREAVFDFGGMLMLDLRASPSESVVYWAAKRGFDVVCSLAGLILLAPLMALIAVAIRLTSGNPVIFAQERVGLNGRVFRMHKFRTMKPVESAESDTRWTTADDPRRTGLGAFLRRTNLDELPQLLNVLKGEMSIVGPRPERPYFVDKFIQEVAQYNTRHYLKVGMTGWAQVNGWRGDTSIPRRLEHDLYYLRNWSLLLDLKIIFLTLWQSLTVDRNAY